MKLTVTSAPHIKSEQTTRHIMLHVSLALLPTLAAGAVIHGTRALLVVLSCVAAALIGEGLWRVVSGQHQTLDDGSAVVTGMLLGLSLPVTVPYWLPVVGGAVAVVVFKGLCGGLGQNAFNPALAARALLLLLWPVHMTRYPGPGANPPLLGEVDVVTAATPLHEMRMGVLPKESLLDMFLGNIGGCIGEVSTLAILVGGVYLAARRIISLRLSLSFLGSVTLMSLIFSRGGEPGQWMLYHLLGGGVMLGAVFMVTDYSSAPVTPRGKILYGVGCGVLTVIFRNVGLFPEAFTYAVLLMNGAAWLIDEHTAPRRFGGEKGAA